MADEYKEVREKEKLKSEMEKARLKEWQAELRGILRKKPDKRKVMWYFDLIGNSGKNVHVAIYLINDEWFQDRIREKKPSMS